MVSSPKLEINPLNPAQDPSRTLELSRFAVHAYIDTYGYEMDLAQRTVEEDFRAREFTAASGSDTILVGTIGEQVVGYAQFGHNEGESRGIQEFRKLYVAKHLHGRGVGPSLMDEALASPDLQSADHIYLWVWGENTRAIRFYEKYGFTTASQRQYLGSGGKPTFDVAMLRSRP